MVSIGPSLSYGQHIYMNKNQLPKCGFRGTSDDNNTRIDRRDPLNPITRAGEYCLGVQRSFYDSLKLGGRAFAETIAYSSGSLTDNLLTSAIIGIVLGVGAFAASLPKNLYQANIDFHAKSEQANVDLATYRTDKAIYDQLAEKGENAKTEEEKKQLGDYLIKMKIASH